MLRFLDVANGLTLVSLVSAVTCALLAMAGHITWAVIALILSGLCDLFDGFVARRLSRSDERRQFGGNLDTVVDSCAFGFAPVVLLYSSGLKSAAEAVLLAFFDVCRVAFGLFRNCHGQSRVAPSLLRRDADHVRRTVPACGVSGRPFKS